MNNSKQSDCLIYGVNINHSVTPIMVRDAIIACFTEAHAKELEELRGYSQDNEEQFEATKKIDVEMIIKKMFEETNHDFDNPTKESLLRVISKLAEFARNFRDQETVSKHYQNIQTLIAHIE